ncbi:hypothetical protein V493_00103 [Pseudogymnoascus sp. VKM F-4281 (FW-2241)]|nr:hypothetical protein V493_00103 [Pseudogymnoascus sp. VKM F-4281 (FW-2241)]
MECNNIHVVDPSGCGSSGIFDVVNGGSSAESALFAFAAQFALVNRLEAVGLKATIDTQRNTEIKHVRDLKRSVEDEAREQAYYAIT